MRHLPVNLATLPFERTRRVRRVLLAVTLVLVLLSTLHAGAAVLLVAGNGSRPSGAAAEGASFSEKVREWRAEADRLAAAADPARARQVGQAVDLANELIAWREIPWGSLFDTLEVTLPPGVRLELVQPSSEPDGVRVELVAAAAAAAAADLRVLLAALEQRPTLSRVVPVYEERAADGRHLMRIQATFRRPDRQPSERR